MTIHYQGHGVALHHGDCLDVLRILPDASVDSVVTDPPYGLEFMGKEWDAPWQKGDDVNADAGIGVYDLADGYTRLPKPSYTGSTNPKCLTCGGTQRGRKDGTAARKVCTCESPRFPNVRAVEMRAFQRWCELWAAECLRVLKPGGHLLAFGGTRTWHRLACAVEDAGFEVRDSIAWMYGSGFSKGGLLGNKPGVAWCECGENPLPYNHADIAHLSRVRDDVHPPAVPRREGEDGLLLPEVQRGSQGSGLGGARAQGPGSVEPRDGGASGRLDARREEPGMGWRDIHRAGEGLPDGADAGAPPSEGERLRGGTSARDGSADRAAGDAARGGASHQRRPGGQPAGEPEALRGSHGALDDGARRDGMGCPRCGGIDPAFRGFSTTLKPAFEPVVVARKPLSGTVAANVLAHGTGALNIDACRIGDGGGTTCTNRDGRGDCIGHAPAPTSPRVGVRALDGGGMVRHGADTMGGRWPANVVLDESQAEALDEQSGTLTSGKMKPTHTTAGVGGRASAYGKDAAGGFTTMETYGDSGGASRFFKVAAFDCHDDDPCDECPDCEWEAEEPDLPIDHLEARFKYVAKAPKRERPVVDGVAHPTVKPLALMRWLVRLVTPPGGTVLEPFAGSGTTVEACLLEGFQCIAIEKGDEYLPLILERIARQDRARIEAEVTREPDPARAIAEQVAEQLDIFGEATA